MDMARMILYEYLMYTSDLRGVVGRSNKSFRGYLFTNILARHLAEYIPESHRIVIGPLWIKGLEWIEWDMAVVKMSSVSHNKWLGPENIIILFECKVSGIYGKRERLYKILNRIQDNFKQAYERCINLRRCIYVSLMEAKPRNTGVNYYQETKKILNEYSIIFFNSRSVENLLRRYGDNLERVAEKAAPLDSWEKLIKKIRL